MDIRPGSMGRPLPGVEAAIVRKLGEDRVEVIEEPDVQGELALRPGWPSMFRGYWQEPERYRKCFAGGFYLTGDLARRDRDGYFWFVGRADDVIKSSGHLIGPFEVESVLLEHKAVAEAGVIGKPDPVAMEVVKAFVSLKDGYEPTEELRRDLLAFARSRLGAVVAPKEIAFQPSLPKTRSGKIMRRLLKAHGSSGCRKATPRRSRPDRLTRSTQCTPDPAPADAPDPALRERLPSSTAWARSTASSTSTSARRRWRSAPCRRSRLTTTSWPRTASTGRRWPAGSRPAP
jgi:hypothetical protein